jgi:hypothetical protein
MTRMAPQELDKQRSEARLSMEMLQKELEQARKDTTDALLAKAQATTDVKFLQERCVIVCVIVCLVCVRESICMCA